MRYGRIRYAKPRWAWLYAVLTALVALLGVIEVGVPDGPIRRTLEILVTLGIFAVMALWVARNRVRLALEDERRHGRESSRELYVLRNDELGPTPVWRRYASGAVEEYVAAVGNGRAPGRPRR